MYEKEYIYIYIYIYPIKGKIENIKCGIWTHALSRRPELESGALDHSAILTLAIVNSKHIINLVSGVINFYGPCTTNGY